MRKVNARIFSVFSCGQVNLWVEVQFFFSFQWKRKILESLLAWKSKCKDFKDGYLLVPTQPLAIASKEPSLILNARASILIGLITGS